MAAIFSFLSSVAAVHDPVIQMQCDQINTHKMFIFIITDFKLELRRIFKIVAYLLSSFFNEIVHCPRFLRQGDPKKILV